MVFSASSIFPLVFYMLSLSLYLFSRASCPVHRLYSQQLISEPNLAANPRVELDIGKGHLIKALAEYDSYLLEKEPRFEIDGRRINTKMCDS